VYRIGLLPRHSPERIQAHRRGSNMRTNSAHKCSCHPDDAARGVMALRLAVSRGIGVIDTSSFVLAQQVHGLRSVDVFVVRVCTRSLDSTPVFVFDSRTEHTKCKLCDERKKPLFKPPTADHSASIRPWNATISWSVRFCDVLRACEHSNEFDRQCYDSVP
jgi:hypothetical protein